MQLIQQLDEEDKTTIFNCRNNAHKKKLKTSLIKMWLHYDTKTLAFCEGLFLSTGTSETLAPAWGNVRFKNY